MCLNFHQITMTANSNVLLFVFTTLGTNTKCFLYNKNTTQVCLLLKTILKSSAYLSKTEIKNKLSVKG